MKFSGIAKSVIPFEKYTKRPGLVDKNNMLHENRFVSFEYKPKTTVSPSSLLITVQSSPDFNRYAGRKDLISLKRDLSF